MNSQARRQRYKERFAYKAQRLRDRLTRIWTWSRCGATRSRSWLHERWQWGRTISRDAWSGREKVVGWVSKPWFIRGVVGIALIVAVVLVIWSPKRQVAEVKDYAKRLELEDKARSTLAQILAGLGIAVGLYFTWRRVKAAEEGQITERFTRAIDQLGATDEQGRKRLELRLGGIYALERIARDSEKDHWPIMEVLTAYVREHAPWNDDSQAQQDPRPEADIHAILTVLRRRTRWYGRGEKGYLNLHGTDMRGANLSRAHLEGAFLKGAHLERAVLSDARLDGATLILVHLEGAYLQGAHLNGAYLREAKLRDAFLNGAKLCSASLGGVDLRGAHLDKEHIIHNAHLGEKTDLVKADLEEADLRGAHLEEADLREAHLEGADLRGAHLEGADLTGAHGLTLAQLRSAHTDAATRLPGYLSGAQEADDNA